MKPCGGRRMMTWRTPVSDRVRPGEGASLRESGADGATRLTFTADTPVRGSSAPGGTEAPVSRPRERLAL